MSDEITSSSILISMLMQLRQENKELSNELTTAQLMLRTLQSSTGSEFLDAAAPSQDESGATPRMVQTSK